MIIMEILLFYINLKMIGELMGTDGFSMGQRSYQDKFQLYVKVTLFQ